MADLEKAIKGLEHCRTGASCDGCRYDINSSKCMFLLHADVLELLKEYAELLKKYAELKDRHSFLVDKFDDLLAILKERNKGTCKDCRHATAQTNDLVWCGHVDDGLAHDPDWYCKDWEKKE